MLRDTFFLLSLRGFQGLYEAQLSVRQGTGGLTKKEGGL
jgi:hypothetical protein